MLQLNLCNSGIAGCWTGMAVGAAEAVIRAESPDAVTLNEVCRDDVDTLADALAGTSPRGVSLSRFEPARDGRTGQPYRCRNGEDYGVAVLAAWSQRSSGPTAAEPALAAGVYPAQDGADPEQRVWLCLDMDAPSPLTVCTTHLAYTRRDVTADQCRYLFDTVVAGLRARAGTRPLVVAGDLNLRAGDPEMRVCVPAGSVLVDDGGPQHVVAAAGLAVDDHRLIDLQGTTDHPGLLVTLGRR